MDSTGRSNFVGWWELIDILVLGHWDCFADHVDGLSGAIEIVKEARSYEEELLLLERLGPIPYTVNGIQYSSSHRAAIEVLGQYLLDAYRDDCSREDLLAADPFRGSLKIRCNLLEERLIVLLATDDKLIHAHESWLKHPERELEINRALKCLRSGSLLLNLRQKPMAYGVIEACFDGMTRSKREELPNYQRNKNSANELLAASFRLKIESTGVRKPSDDEIVADFVDLAPPECPF